MGYLLVIKLEGLSRREFDKYARTSGCDTRTYNPLNRTGKMEFLYQSKENAELMASYVRRGDKNFTPYLAEVKVIDL